MVENSQSTPDSANLLASELPSTTDLSLLLGSPKAAADVCVAVPPKTRTCGAGGERLPHYLAIEVTPNATYRMFLSLRRVECAVRHDDSYIIAHKGACLCVSRLDDGLFFTSKKRLLSVTKKGSPFIVHWVLTGGRYQRFVAVHSQALLKTLR